MANVKDEIAERVSAEVRRDMVTREEAMAMATDAATAAANTAVQKLLADLAVAKPTGQFDGMQDVLNGLAMAMAQVGNQGTGKAVVDPAVLEKRSRARKRMFDLIREARDAGNAPEYVLLRISHLADQIIQPFWVDNMRQTQQTRIRWDGVPNEAMEPVPGDEVARGIYEAFCESIDKALGTVTTLRPADAKGNMVSPGGHVFETGPKIPKGYLGPDAQMEGRPSMEIVSGAPERDKPHNGLEVLGRASGMQTQRTVDINVLGTKAPPARQMVA